MFETIPDKFWSRVNRDGPQSDLGRCWEWTGATGAGGYGSFRPYRNGQRLFVIMTHRFAYETFNGLIPAGLVLDHLCRNRTCVNPNHLEPVSRAENNRRGAGSGHALWRQPDRPPLCVNGHALTEENTKWESRKGKIVRQCKTCRANSTKAYRQRRGNTHRPSIVKTAQFVSHTEDSLWSLVDKGPVLECWRWLGSLSDAGYGTVTFGGKRQQAHRVIYELTTGQIPGGLVLDHLCRTRDCCNPAHLEPVTRAENRRRGAARGAILAPTIELATHCKHGHEFTEDNTIRKPNGWRVCRTCQRDARRKARHRKNKELLETS